MSRRLEFKESAIKLRNFLTPEEIRARDISRFGIKVQITDPTLQKIFAENKKLLTQEILVNDPADVTFLAEGRPQRKIKRIINLASVTLSLENQLKGLESLVTTVGAFNEDQAVVTGGLLQTMLEKIKDLSEIRIKDLKIIQAAVDKLNIPQNPVDAGLQIIMTGPQVKAKRGAVLIFALANVNKVPKMSSVNNQIVRAEITPELPFYSIELRQRGENISADHLAVLKPVGINVLRTTKKRVTEKNKVFNLKFLVIHPDHLTIDDDGVLRNINETELEEEGEGEEEMIPEEDEDEDEDEDDEPPPLEEI